MLSVKYLVVFYVNLRLFTPATCTIDLPPQPSLRLSSPGDLDYTEVIVKRVGDDLTLTCSLTGDAEPRVFVWNFVAANGSTSHKPFTVSSAGPLSSTIHAESLRIADSGHYMCSAPPFSRTKYIAVQDRGPSACAKGSFWCGRRCVLALYVCDGAPDCAGAEDEAPGLCPPRVCARADKLNCSSGRCIPAAACCRAPPCVQPACCHEHAGFPDVEYPPFYEDRHAPDDYGFIQSTIYTVTACALIFMIAVVLLVSAVCKMHMKRAALRTYSTRQHYDHYTQSARFPPCYEASRLLEQARVDADPQGAVPAGSGVGLARLSAMFTSRYTQVPTQCCDVEMTPVPPSRSAPGSPLRPPPLSSPHSPPLSPPLSPGTARCARALNRTSPVRAPLTLQLGRFHLTIPRLTRSSSDTRPDTPNVAEININDLDFVRLNSNDTYTLNGRTIRLLGGNFENYPVLADGTRPPPYTEAMRYKLYGPPPEYLSREGISTVGTEEAARNNIEMPPCYEDLASGLSYNNNQMDNDSMDYSLPEIVTVVDDNDDVSMDVNTLATDSSNLNSNNRNNSSANHNNITDNHNSLTDNRNNPTDNHNNANNTLTEASVETSNNNSGSYENITAVMNTLPAIDSDLNANEAMDTARSMDNAVISGMDNAAVA